MKTNFHIPLTLFFSGIFLLSALSVQAQNDEIDPKQLIGAWKGEFTDSSGKITGVAIMTDGYYAVCRFDVDNKRFLYTLGGKWSVSGNLLIEMTEFNTQDPSLVGKEAKHKIELKGDRLTFVDSGESWERLDNGRPGALEGAWLITKRKRDGELRSRPLSTRKTMKILSGTRFQWIAYDTNGGKFFGTGGGYYTAKNGKYTESIDFFSRNAERVGAELEFDFDIQDGEWHHSGLSSKGNPIYEVWTLRNQLEE